MIRRSVPRPPTCAWATGACNAAHQQRAPDAKLLDCPRVDAGRRQPAREGVPERVRRDVLKARGLAGDAEASSDGSVWLPILPRALKPSRERRAHAAIERHCPARPFFA